MLNGLQTLAQMKREVAFAVNDFTESKAAKIEAAINRRYLYVAGVFRWAQLEHADESGLRIFTDSDRRTLEAGEPEAPLPQGMGRLVSLHHQDSRRAALQSFTLKEFYSRVVTQTANTGYPWAYTKIGDTAQYRRLADAGPVTAKSSTSANNALVARVYFRKQGGHIGQANWADVTGNFVAGVSVGSGVRLDAGFPVEKVVLPAAWTGNFQILDGSANVLVDIQRIEEPNTASNATEVTYQRQLIRVWPTPDADYGLTVTWLRDVQSLTEDEDVPLMPVSRALVEGAIADILTQKGETDLANKHEALFTQYAQVAAGVQQSNQTPQVTPRYRNMRRGVGIWHYNN